MNIEVHEYVCNLDIIKYLVEEKGINVHKEDGSVLRSAAFEGCLPVVQYLIEQCGVDIHTKGQTLPCVYNSYRDGTDAMMTDALDLAIYKGHTSIIKYLIDNGADKLNPFYIDYCKGNIRYIS